MMRIKIKRTVKLDGALFAIGYAARVAQEAYEGNGAELVLTSVNDSTHGQGSLHYKGLALDLRTKHLTSEQKGKILAELKEDLDPDKVQVELGAVRLGFDVIDEGDHFHIEFDPKPGESLIERVD